MQVIQTIRDKGAAIVIAVIALSLIGFLLMDAKQGSSNFFNSLSSNVGKVNGEAFERADFEQKFKQADEIATRQSQQYGRKPDAGQIRQQVWDNFVTQVVFSDEAKKLGIDFSAKELSSLFYSNDQENPFLQGSNGAFTDSATGKLDRDKVTQKLAEMKRAKGDDADNYKQITDQVRMQNMFAKYNGLLSASAYYPSWMQEKDNAEAKNFASITYVQVPYAVINDSTINVTDQEIDSYVAKHKNQFKQEAGRIISYVAFSQLPSAADSASTKDLVAAQKSAMETETNMSAFLAKNASAIPFDTSFKAKASIGTSMIDTIAKLPVGTVYGPYLDKTDYVLAKVVAIKTTPDSAKARHILIPTVDPQSGQMVNTDSAAKSKADSILAAVNAGADFAALAKQYSSDQGSKDKGGFYDYFPYGQMMPTFNDFAFDKPAGTRGIVKTPYGYHVIEAMGQKGSSNKYKIAFLAKEITPSEATMSNANLNATKLSGQKGGKDFEAYVAKNGLQKSLPPMIKENDYMIGYELQDARLLIRWAFEANVGDVSEPFNIGNQFIVAMLEKVQSEGTQDAKTARQMVQGVVRNHKKAEMIIKQLGANPTLDKAAADYKQQIVNAGADSSITFNSFAVPNLGEEAKVIGASFNKDNQTKVSAPIEGGLGVYIVKVNSIGTKPADTPEAAALQKKQQTDNLRSQTTSGWFEGLKNQANIKDGRSKYY
ncbi:peptidylprolyl isomerase [Ferruginibacter sp.]